MPPEIKRLSREELYALVWAEPMTKVAARFHLSDVGLKKICRKHWIPVPGRGYWQMLQAGQRVKQPPLPRTGQAPMIDITVRPRVPANDESLPQSVVQQAQTEENPENRIVVAERLERPHEVTQNTRRALNAGRLDDYRMLKCHDPGAFYVRVRRPTIGRVLRIIDALVKACVTRGFLIKAGTPQDRSQAKLIVNGETLGLSIEERLRRQAHELTARERAELERSRWSSAPKYDYVPTGELTLKLDGGYGSGLRSNWSDGRHQRLEDCLNQVIVSLVQMAAWLTAERLKREERERRFQAEQDRRAALRHRVEQERQAVTKLEKDAQAWQRARTIRAYVDAVEAKARASGTPNDEQANWTVWARQQADRIDPLSENPPSVLDVKEEAIHPLSWWEWDRDAQ